MYDSAPIIGPFSVTSLGVALHITVFMAIAFRVVFDAFVTILCVVCFLYLFSVPVVCFLHCLIFLVIVLFRCLVLLVSVPVELDVFLLLIVLFKSVPVELDVFSLLIVLFQRIVPMPVLFRLLK